MSTTAVIVELLIVGVFSLLWLILFGLRLSLVDVTQIKILFSRGGDWANLVLFLTVAIVYPLGMFVNALSEEFTKRTVKGIKEKVFIHQENYERERADVYQHGSSELVQDLKLSFSAVRLARSGVLNFALIAISLFSFGRETMLLGIVSLLVGSGCLILYRNMLFHYYFRLFFAHQTVIGDVSKIIKPEEGEAKTNEIIPS